MRFTGIVTHFNDSRGVGRIQPDADPELELWVHWTQCPGNTLSLDDRVEFDCVIADIPEAHRVLVLPPVSATARRLLNGR